ncbi:MAG: hypothetical protein LBG19_01110 [Prevotellaceae bacterium]|jgi:hypothetical protein|nr:hypothetical protein [Prevotellaceae bacterium]
MICDINGDNNKILVTPTDLSNCDYLYGPYWTYDGKSIVFSGELDKVE